VGLPKRNSQTRTVDFIIQSDIPSTGGDALSTLANLKLIILFSKMLKFSKIISSKSKNIVKENSEIFRNIVFVEMNFSKLIHYLMDMC
jgi:hypothetical protein